MNVYDETSSSMWVTWGSVEDATGYMLLYRPINEPQLEKEVDLLCFHIQLLDRLPPSQNSLRKRARKI